jgi:hypothetical protein
MRRTADDRSARERTKAGSGANVANRPTRDLCRILGAGTEMTTSDEEPVDRGLARLHSELVEGQRLYGRLEDDWFVIEQVGSPPLLLSGREGAELSDAGPSEVIDGPLA